MSSTPDSSGPVRLVQLDLLRALAVFMVMGRHLWAPPWNLPGWLEPLVAAWQRGGWAGVDLFFVLSGFLVAGLLFKDWHKQGRLDVTRFYVRRGLKIYPAFLVFVPVSLAVRSCAGERLSWDRIWPELVFLQNYWRGSFAHTWSLAVEEHFYLTLPLLLLAVGWFGRGGNPYRVLLPLVAVLAVLAACLRWHQFVTCPYHHRTHLQPTHLRFDALLIGVALAHVYHFHRDWLDRWVRPWPALFVGLGAGIFVLPHLWLPDTRLWMYSVGLSLLSLGAASLIVGLLYLPLPASFWVRGVGWVGSHSYSIYLWHMLVLSAVGWLHRSAGEAVPFPARVCLYVLGSVAVGVLMARLVEVPVLRLRDRWFPSSTPSLTAQPSPLVVLQPRPSLRPQPTPSGASPRVGLRPRIPSPFGWPRVR